MYMYMFVLQACATGYYSFAGSCNTICLFYRLVQPVTIVPLVHVYVCSTVHVYVCSTGLCERLL